MGHSSLESVTTAANFLFLASFFLAGWFVMITAMMLPAIIPVLNQFRQRTRQSLERRTFTSTVVLGYLSPWIVYGILMNAFDLGIHRISDSSIMIGNTWIFGVSALAMAGVYELTPLKQRYIMDCCYPRDLIASSWHRNSGKSDAFLLGINYGKSTIGCSWALMLLMFALGMGNILWMLFFGIIMGVEKLSATAAKTRLLLGGVLVGIAFLGIIINL